MASASEAGPPSSFSVSNGLVWDASHARMQTGHLHLHLIPSRQTTCLAIALSPFSCLSNAIIDQMLHGLKGKVKEFQEQSSAQSAARK